MDTKMAHSETQGRSVAQKRVAEGTGTAQVWIPRLVPLRARLCWLLGSTGWGVLITLSLLVLIWQVVIASQGHSDFCQDYIASLRLLQGQQLYEPLHLWPGYRNCAVPIEYAVHPPFLVLFFAPLALLPKVLAFQLWGFLSLACYLVSGLLLLRTLGWFSLRGAALFVAGSLIWEPVVEAEEGIQNLGQLLLFLLVIAWLLERKRSSWAGGVLGLATLIKFWPAALLFGALGRRQWRLALAGGLVIIAGVALTCVAPGPGAYLTYAGPIQAAELAVVPHETNISLVGLLTRLWTGYRDPIWSPPLVLLPLLSGLSLSQAVHAGEVIAGLLLVGVLLLIGWCWRRSQAEPVVLLGEAVLVTVLLLVCPVSWYAGLLLLPGAMLVLALRQLPRLPRWWGVLLGMARTLLVRPEVTVALFPRWMPALRQAGLAGWGTVLVNLPTFALLLLAGLQGYLLWQASKLTGRQEQEMGVPGG